MAAVETGEVEDDSWEKTTFAETKEEAAGNEPAEVAGFAL